jgi:hypothetical protein
MEPQFRGRAFEGRVLKLLDWLKQRNPERSNFLYQPRVRLSNGEILIPDFELRYDAGYQEDRRLIECQSRDRSSQDIVHKIRHAKSLSAKNRFILVYEVEEFLREPTRLALAADGIVFYSFQQFETFIERLDVTLRTLHANNEVSLGGGSGGDVDVEEEE